MSAIWRDSGVPSFFAPKPIFDFHELSEIHEPASATYAQALKEMRMWEESMGATYFQQIAIDAHELWQLKRPWWLL